MACHNLRVVPLVAHSAKCYIFGACVWDLTHSGLLCSHQVARAGRFGTKGLAITFVSDETDAKTLNDVQDRFEVNVAELPDEIDISSYSKSSHFLVPAEMQLLNVLYRVGLTGWNGCNLGINALYYLNNKLSLLIVDVLSFAGLFNPVRSRQLKIIS